MNGTRSTIGLLLVLLLAVGAVLSASCAGSGNAGTEGEGEEAGSGESEPAVDGEGDGDGEGEDEEKEEPVPVEIAEITRGRIEAVLRASSNLEAESHVQVFSRSPENLIRELIVEEGDRVERGKVLLRLEDVDQRNDLAKVRSQLSRAEREYERQKRLFDQQMISEQVFNEATSELEQLRIELDEAERALGHTEVRAPIAGTITARNVTLGQRVTLGQHLFDLVDFDSIVALVYVPEKNLRELRPGQSARIWPQALDAREYRGRVKRIAPVVDPKSGTVKVTVGVGRQPGLRPGMYVDVELVTAVHESALLVPKRALVYDRDRVFVYRVGDDERAERVVIVPVLSDKEHVEPMSGLAEGDRLVVAGQAGLKDGALVGRLGEDQAEEETADEQASIAERKAEPAPPKASL